MFIGGLTLRVSGAGCLVPRCQGAVLGAAVPGAVPGCCAGCSRCRVLSVLRTIVSAPGTAPDTWHLARHQALCTWHVAPIHISSTSRISAGKTSSSACTPASASACSRSVDFLASPVLTAGPLAACPAASTPGAAAGNDGDG